MLKKNSRSCPVNTSGVGLVIATLISSIDRWCKKCGIARSRLLLLIILAQVAPFQGVADAALTQVSDRLYRADGGTCSGFFRVSWQTFVAAGDGHLVVQGAITVPVVAGLLTVSLEPASYTVNYQLTPAGCVPNQEYWLVPTSSSPVPLSTVRSLNPPTPPTLLGLAYLGQGGATTGQCLAWSGSAWAPSSSCGGGGGSSAFSALTTSTNSTATMTVGTGASLTFSGSGVINANQVFGTAISAITGSGSLVLATSPAIVTPTIASFVNATHNHQNAAGGGTLAEAALALTDITTNNGTTSAHGFVPKGDNNAAHFLNGQLAWVAASGGSGCTTSGSSGQIVVDNGSGGCTSTTPTISGSTITASLTGHASLDLPLTGGTISSNLTVSGHTTLEGVTSTGATGTGKLVYDTSPTLSAPTLGAATVTTVNKITITQPATGSTLTIIDGKTLRSNNTLTLAGTDATTMTFPTTSATVARTDAANTFTGHQTIEGVTATGATGTGNMVYASSPALTTPTIADFTNATHDHSSTSKGGTVAVAGLPAFARSIWVEAAGCNNATASSAMDLPTSAAASASCITGTNIQKGVLQYVSTATTINSAQFTFKAPTGTTGTLDFNVIWNSAGTSGNMKWFVGVACTATNATATDDPAFTDSTVTTAVPGTTLRIQISSITGATGCSAGNLVHIRVKRDTNDGADTLASTVNLVGIETVIRVTPQS